MKSGAVASLLTVAQRSLDGETKLERGSVLLAAVSGGPDSMALLHVLSRLASPLGLAIHAHGVDHGLRPAASRELDVAEAFSLSVSVPFSRTQLAIEFGGNLQARAREGRYAALAKAAHNVGARAIATAHHADDRAETVVMRLLRGAGPQGLAALLPRSRLGDSTEGELELVRPLLRARREALHAHVARHAVPFSTDPSNRDPRFLRVRVRHDVMPLLELLSPSIVDHLVALADQLVSARGSETTSFPMPRSTQVALAELARTRSKTARVWLPGGLVAAVDPKARPTADVALEEDP